MCVGGDKDIGATWCRFLNEKVPESRLTVSFWLEELSTCTAAKQPSKKKKEMKKNSKGEEEKNGMEHLNLRRSELVWDPSCSTQTCRCVFVFLFSPPRYHSKHLSCCAKNKKKTQLELFRSWSVEPVCSSSAVCLFFYICTKKIGRFFFFLRLYFPCCFPPDSFEKPS